ncbi:MAG: hypothetical protein H7A46_00035 [Verrucomicrobiales bacterium]|nr:hypothetical protein [Verrucomicrobiales bacterium]
MKTKTRNRLQDVGFIELLTRDPIPPRRLWAATLLLRMLEQHSSFGYRTHDRLAGEDHAEAAIRSLRTALAALRPNEQPLMLRATLLIPWEDVRRRTGLTLRVPEILTALMQEVGAECMAAVQSVIGQGLDAVRRYPLAGLLPEVRLPEEDLVIALDADDRRLLRTSRVELRIDRVTAAVESFRTSLWETNLRALVPWWIQQLDEPGRDDRISMFLSALPNAAGNDAVRWQSLGLLDWLVIHPTHPQAEAALRIARQARRADVRKAAAALAQALGRRSVLEALAEEDPDKGVRQRAAKLLTQRDGTTSARHRGRPPAGGHHGRTL